MTLSQRVQARRGAAASNTGAPAGAIFVQRKCACGPAAGSASGTCDECRKRHAQAKLAIGAPDDAYEREADRISDDVMSGRSSAGVRPSPIQVQRVPQRQDAGAVDGAPASVGRTLAGPGQRLDVASRALMERRFGRAFGDVRVHVDGLAADSAVSIGARAYTHGRNIVFAAGEYRPDTAVGLRLLAHELTHVLQQSGNGEALVQRDLAIKPQGVNQKQRKLSEQDIKDAIAFNAQQVKKKETLRKVRDVIGVSPEPAVSDRDLVLGVARWQASHGVAQDGRLEPTTVMLIVEELQAEGATVKGLGTVAKNLKGEFAKGAIVDIDTSHCGCKADLEHEIKSADFMIGEYKACGADSKNKTGADIENCKDARAATKGIKLTTLGTTSSSAAIALTGARKGPCAKLMESIDLAHERIHSVHTKELQQKFGAGSKAFDKAFNDASDWVADEVNSRNTDKSMANWALSVLKRICP